MSNLYKKALVSIALAAASRSIIKPVESDFIYDEQSKNKWRGGSRGKGGKTKWPRR